MNATTEAVEFGYVTTGAGKFTARRVTRPSGLHEIHLKNARTGRYTQILHTRLHAHFTPTR